MTVAVLPNHIGEFEVRLGHLRPDRAVYMRRRLLVGLVFVALFTLVAFTASTVLADRGAVPASSPAIRPAPAGAISSPLLTPTVAATSTYLVQSGDTLWSIAEQFRGDRGMSSYVEALIAANGGATTLQIGQSLTLP